MDHLVAKTGSTTQLTRISHQPATGCTPGRRFDVFGSRGGENCGLRIALSLLLAITLTACSPKKPPISITPPSVSKQPDKTKPSSASLERAVVSVAKNMHAQKLMYSGNPKNLRDCSGIFYRFQGAMSKRCRSFTAPPVTMARSSSMIAHWYDKQKALRMIHDPRTQGSLIEPGAILFYGQRYKRRQQTLNNIEHVGVVVAVNKNKAGKVVSYQLFHGRSPGKAAAITKHHSINAKPPLGNGKQRWVAVADICINGNCVCE